MLGGALLGELATTGAVEVEEKTDVWRSAESRTAQDLVDRLGKGARDALAGGCAKSIAQGDRAAEAVRDAITAVAATAAAGAATTRPGTGSGQAVERPANAASRS